MSLADELARKWIYNGVQVERYSVGVQARVNAILQRMGQDLIKLAMRGEMTSFQTKRFKAMVLEARRIITKGMDHATSYIDDEMRNLYATQIDTLPHIVNKILGGEVISTFTLTKEQLESIMSDVLVEGAPIKEWLSRRTEFVVQHFADQMRVGLMRGETVTQLRDRIMGKTDLRKVPAGERTIIATARRGMEALVRTSSHAVANAAHMESFQQNADLLSGMSWLATLDTRTCMACGEKDGTIYTFEELKQGPPLHWSCRCTLCPVLRSLSEIAGVNKKLARKLDDLLDGGTRASMDGQVPAKLTYEDWLHAQSEEVQRDVLGAGRYSLFTSGKLSLADMLDQRGNPISLTRLRSRA